MALGIKVYKKKRDEFFQNTLERLSNDASKTALYAIYRVANITMLWGTIFISYITGSTLISNLIAELF